MADTRDSEIIKYIRFPLAFMVVMLHSFVAVRGFHISQVDYMSLTGADVYSLVGITFSHVLTQVAVPLFFFISGYLFYNGLKEWKWTKYGEKLQRRIRTLLIPYITWNTIQASLIVAIILILGGNITKISEWFHEIGGLVGVYWSDQTSTIIKENMLGWSSAKSYPLLMPMWFIRDLMVVVLFSPLIWYLLKRIQYLMLALVGFLWVTGAGTIVFGLSYNALLFFTVGGAFSLKSVSCVKVFLRINKWVLITLFIALGLLSIVFDGRSTNVGQIVLSSWILVAIPLCYRVAGWCINRYPIFSSRVSGLSDSTYFIFALHGVIISYVYSALWKMFGVVKEEGLLSSNYLDGHAINGILAYLLTPVLTVILCLVAFYITKRVMKSLSWPLTGK